MSIYFCNQNDNLTIFDRGLICNQNFDMKTVVSLQIDQDTTTSMENKMACDWTKIGQVPDNLSNEPIRNHVISFMETFNSMPVTQFDM